MGYVIEFVIFTHDVTHKMFECPNFDNIFSCPICKYIPFRIGDLEFHSYIRQYLIICIQYIFLSLIFQILPVTKLQTDT